MPPCEIEAMFDEIDAMSPAEIDAHLASLTRAALWDDGGLHRTSRRSYSTSISWCQSGPNPSGTMFDGLSLTAPPSPTAPRRPAHLDSGPHLGIYKIRPGSDVTPIAVFDVDDHGGKLTWSAMQDHARRIIEAASLCQSRPSR